MTDWAGCCYKSPPGKYCLEYKLDSLAELSWIRDLEWDFERREFIYDIIKAMGVGYGKL
jgi:hypothetical protein